MDFSGSKGFHLWVLLKECPMAAAQNFLRHALTGLATLPYDIHIDVFPKPASDPSLPYGYPVKLPCGFHRGVEVFSHFVDDNLCGVVDVLAHLQKAIPCEVPNLPILQDSKPPKKKRRPAKRRPRSQRVTSILPDPKLTPEISRLFRGCQFMRNFPRGNTPAR